MRVMPKGMPRGVLFLAEGLGEAVDRQRAVHRALGMVGQVDGRVEDREHRIADELVHHAVVFQHLRATPSR